MAPQRDVDFMVCEEWFDEPLERAIKAFQQDHGLTPDGLVGKDTLAALNTAPGAWLALCACSPGRAASGATGPMWRNAAAISRSSRLGSAQSGL